MPAAKKAKKTNTPIPKAGAKSVDPLAQAKKAIEDKLNSTSQKVKVEVDDHVPGRERFEVISEDGRTLSVYLMWSDLKNNHNKFYILQALKETATGRGYLWTRYGRVGADGVKSLDPMGASFAVKSF